MNDHIDCAVAMRKMFEFLDSEIAEVDADEIREHLNACAECLDEFDYQVAVQSLVRRSCQQRAPETLRARLVAQIRVTTVTVHTEQFRPPTQ